MNTPVRIAAFLGLLVALCTGFYWLGHERGLADAEALKLPAPDTLRENTRLRDENARLTV
jgi:hypothetical protein